MKKISTWAFLFCKRIIKMPIIMILLILIPILSFAITNITSNSEGAIVSFGVYFETDGRYSSIIREALLNNDDALFFVEYNDLDKMKHDVMTGKLEAGYYFDEDFDDNISKQKFRASLKSFLSPSTLLAAAGNEIIFSNIMKVCGYEIMGNYITNLPLESDQISELRNQVNLYYDAYCTNGETFHLDIQTEHGVKLNEDGNKSIGVTFPLRGLLSILIFLASLTGSVAWCKDKEQGIFAPRSSSFVLLSRIFYPLIPALLFLLCSQLALFLSHMNYPLGTEILVSLRYILLLTIFGNVCMLIFKKSNALISLIPVLILGSLIFCPVFVNIETLMPALSFFSKLFIPRYFM